MKLKSNKDFTVRDQLMKYQNEEKTSKLEREPEVRIDSFDVEKNNKLIAYNEAITNINPVYASLKPIRQVLLRVFTTPAKIDDNGIFVPNTIYVKRVTESGFGYAGETENPFPYSKKAIVVAVPETLKQSLSVGDIVLLSDDQVSAVVAGKGTNAEIIVKNAFVRNDIYTKKQIPSDPENEHYGYILVDYSNIQFKL